MIITTFNANSIRSRLGIVIGWLQANQPDVLCIQETKVQDADFPQQAFTDAGYHIAFRGEKSYNGVAIASRVKPDAVDFGLDDGGPADTTRFVVARFGDLQVVNTYVPQGREIEHPMYAYKLDWFRRLRVWFSRHATPDDLLLWTGDLNVAPDAMDIHNAEQQANHVCYHVDVRRMFADTLRWGFTDVFRKYHPEAGQYTFFDYRTPNAVQRKMGWRIDHLLATAPLAARSISASIDVAPRLLEKPSDHTFLSATFDL
ncbi:MAG TPA: exodeoxyribonuclease III [Verrucomicrobia bacterium]|nr:exodeoxyribonuclease III [Verrucomicrobiota bacterium]